MAGTKITQQMPSALPGQRYGSFAGKAVLPPVATVTCGEWSVPVTFGVCDEWRITVAVPAASNPKIRVVPSFT